MKKHKNKSIFLLFILILIPFSKAFGQTETSCYAPGQMIINDSNSNSVIEPEYDIKSLYVSEPFYGDGSDKLVISMQVGNLSQMPDASWNVLYAGSDDIYRFVQLDNLNGTPVFNYGTVSGLQGVPNFTVEGQVSGTYNRSGKITFSVDRSLIGNPNDGFAYNFSGRVYTRPLTDLQERDATEFGNYSLVGNDNCDQNQFVKFGLTGDVPVGNDYTGNGTSDFAVWRPNSGVWFARDSFQPDVSGLVLGNGSNGDIPVPGDYDNDSKGDYAVFRPSEGNWYLFNTETRTFQQKQFGVTGDVPLSGDFDGDGVDDLACWRPSNGTWYLNQSQTETVMIMQFGANGDRPLVGDFDGDQKADIGVFRPGSGEWYVWQTGINTMKAVNFGLGTDQMVPADYNGDGKTDFAVFRPDNGNWYVLYSDNTGYNIFNWGLNGDRVVPGDYNGNGRSDYAVWRPSTGIWYVYHN